MTQAIADHWGKGDVYYGLIVSALHKMSKPLEGLTVEDLAPVDHFHARGLPATVQLADRLPIASGQHILDIGSTSRRAVPVRSTFSAASRGELSE